MSMLIRIADLDSPEISEPKCDSEYELGILLPCAGASVLPDVKQGATSRIRVDDSSPSEVAP